VARFATIPTSLEREFARAEAFTLCDAYHCSFHGGTNPNPLIQRTLPQTNPADGLPGIETKETPCPSSPWSIAGTSPATAATTMSG
jgi:phospholipase C